MVTYNPKKGPGIQYILGITVLYNALLMLAIIFVNSYILSSLLKIFLVVSNIYLLYYIVLSFSLKYSMDNDYIYINWLLKKHKISFEEIKAYKINSGKINGIKLSGFGTSYFAFGKSVIKDIGVSNMFVTSNKNIIFLKLGNTSYAVSPEMFSEFENVLESKNIKQIDWKYEWNKEVHLHKDKSFMIPFFIVSIIVTILTLNPFILYLMDKLPNKMPLNFDSAFMPVDYGTGKQFAFSQMIYGVLNMAIQFCMYYASHFYAKYDRKSANKFIYISLIIASAFLIIQIRILYTFR